MSNGETSTTTLNQQAPFPEALAWLVANVEYRPGWRFSLADEDRGQGSKGLTLTITGQYPNTYNPDDTIRVRHLFPVPPAAYDERSWRRWLFEQILLVERHEAAEFFKIQDDRPYAPSHGFGQDPYLIREIGTEEDQQTNFRNELSTS